MKDVKKATKELLLAVVTGGLWILVIFVKTLFTTPEGQKLVEYELMGKIKAFQIEEEEKNKEPMNQIGFITKD